MQAKGNTKQMNNICKTSSIAERVAELSVSMVQDRRTPVLIAVGGPGGTGKSTFSSTLAEVLGEAAVLRLDDYKTSRRFREAKGILGPHPEANEMDLIRWHLEDMRAGIPFFKPVYDRALGMIDMTELYEPATYNIIDGEVSTYGRFKDLVDISIYIDAQKRTQFKTRIIRDVRDKGYSVKKALKTFWYSNLREFRQYGTQSREWADIVLFCKKDYSLEISQARDK